jgi:molybdopterin converting factor small subunit
MIMNLSADLKEYTGNRETVEVKGKTVREGLANLISQFPAVEGLLFDNMGALSAVVVINGETLAPDDLDHPVEDKKEIFILPLIYGG